MNLESREVLVRRRSEPSAPRFGAVLAVGEDEILTSPLLPGFELPVRAIFAVGGEGFETP